MNEENENFVRYVFSFLRDVLYFLYSNDNINSTNGFYLWKGFMQINKYQKHVNTVLLNLWLSFMGLKLVLKKKFNKSILEFNYNSIEVYWVRLYLKRKQFKNEL